MNTYARAFQGCKSITGKDMKSVMFYDIMIRGRDISTEFYPGSFRAFEAQTSYCLSKKKGMSHNHDQTGCLQWSCELNKSHLNNLFWGGRGRGANSLVISVGYPISTLLLHMVTFYTESLTISASCCGPCSSFGHISTVTISEYVELLPSEG